MANEQNLRPFTSDQNREEAAKNGRKGGIASGQSKRAKKTLRDAFETLRHTEIEIALPDKSRKVVEMDEAAALAMYQQALKGNVHAMTFIATILGEYEKTVKVEGINPVLVTEEERKALDKWAGKEND